MKKLAITIIIGLLACSAFGQGTPILPYITSDWRTILGVSPIDPTFAGLNITNCADLASNSAVFQPGTDSVTFFQVWDAAGPGAGNLPVLTIDTTNKRIGLGTTSPDYDFEAEKTVVGGNVVFALKNSDNTNADSDALFRFSVGGTSGGSPKLVYIIPTGSTWTMGIHNADSDKFKIITGSNFYANNWFTIDTSGNIGFGERIPETQLEMTGTAPYATFHNSTHEDADGGRESRINFKGENAATGAESTLARIQAQHDTANGTQEGELVFYTNDGADGDSPTEAFRLDSSQKATFGGEVVVNNDESADAALTTLGSVHIRGDEDRFSAHAGAGGEIAGEVTRSFLDMVSVTVDPGSWYDSNDVLPLFKVQAKKFPNGIIIDYWEVDCLLDPDVEMNMNLGFSNDWDDVADPNLVDILDTTNGKSSEDTDSNIYGGLVIPAGSALFLYFDADPEGTCTAMKFEMIYHAEED